ncbi:hypothetical protein [Microbulbifer sp. ALW1]|uniref:hypothetical protein n=1 Tax=Microbulbifer sp. (strain ALW1) TaxID=1516059 RepID=UPI0013587FCE|nr:hypothetical protein [Microbulbifer sp. ALW1]
MTSFDHGAHSSGHASGHFGGHSSARSGAYGAQVCHHVNISETETRQLRHRLQVEITWLARQLDELQGAEEAVDLSLRQTYREMIFSRRALLGRIPR